MNLAAIVGTAMQAVPAGLKGSVTIQHVVPGTLDATTDTRTGDTTESFTASNATIAAVPFDELKGTDLKPERVRAVTIAATECTFAPDVGHSAMFGGHTWRVYRALPVAPDGTTPVAYDLRVVR